MSPRKPLRPESVDITAYELSPEQLRWVCPPESFSFDCTDELSPLQEFIGQDRAIGAIEFGLGVHQPGYNVFVSGMTGTGKATVIQAYIRRVLARQRQDGRVSIPSDWCYVFNPIDPDRPHALRMPAGDGRVLKARVERLRGDIERALAGAFSGSEYEAQRKALLEESQTTQRHLFGELDQDAHTQGLALQLLPSGISLAPIVGDHAASPEEFNALPEAERKAINVKQTELMKKVEETVELVRNKATEIRIRMEQLDRQVAEYVTNSVFAAVRREYREQATLQQFLDQLRAYTLDHIDAFRPAPEGPPSPPPAPFADPARLAAERDSHLPFVVNVFVDNTGAVEPPVVVESNPTFGNLFGRIDRRFILGAYVTDHTMLKPGSVSRANGGYLIVNMRDLLTAPLVWETLKRVIRTKEVMPEEPGEALGFPTAQSLKPEPIPLDFKVIVMGDPSIYSLLSAYEEDFWEIFKVRADFGSQITRNSDHLAAYGAFVCGVCNDLKLHHFGRDGVAKVVEHAARLVSDQRKLSTRFGPLRDLLVESDYWARQEGATRVAAAHVQKALAQKVYRSDLIAEHLRQLVQEGTLIIDIAGEAVGQVNGLAVLQLGDVTIGRPSRITARTFIGRGNVVNIEREAGLSGSTYNKGVLIISGYLGWRFAQHYPLSLTISLAFEQSYDMVDGDSASSTEIYAILSSLSGIALRQDIAVTGSVNQKGEIQPIGGADHKIEGFYDQCLLAGLTGTQGVMLPRRNVANLMLREDVVEAVRAGKFHIYAVDTIAQGLEVLTSTLAGERDAKGSFPAGSINALVEEQLRAYAAAQAPAAAGPTETPTTPSASPPPKPTLPTPPPPPPGRRR